MNNYDPKQDFIHHEDLSDVSINEEIIIPSTLYKVSFTFFPHNDYSIKSCYQIFRTFSFIFKEKRFPAKVLKIQKLFEYKNPLDPIEYKDHNGEKDPIYKDSNANEYKDPIKYKYNEIEYKKKTRIPHDKYLDNSIMMKLSLEPCKKQELQSEKEELYEKDSVFFHYIINFLRETLQKPQEYLYKSGGYKPNRVIPPRNKNKKKTQRNLDNIKYLFRCKLLINLEKTTQNLKNFLYQNIGNSVEMPINNLKFSEFRSSNQEILELDFENLKFGLLDFEAKTPSFSYIWELENLNNCFKSELRMKKLTMKIAKKTAEILEISTFFLLKVYEKKEQNLEAPFSRRFLMKITQKSPSKVLIQRLDDSIVFFLDNCHEFPKCFYSEVLDDDYKDFKRMRTFHRTHDFLLDSKELDEFLMSYLRFKAGVSLLFNREQTKNQEFKRFCEVLKKNGLLKGYLKSEESMKIVGFKNLKPELTKAQFVNIKYLDFKAKYLLLVLDSMDKMKLYSQSLHEIERLRDCDQKLLEISLINLAKSPFQVINIDEILKEMDHLLENKLINPPEFSISDNSLMNIRKVLISPSGISRYFLEEPLLAIRELSLYRKDYHLFIIAGFVDEDLEEISKEKPLLWGFFQDFLHNLNNEQKTLNILNRNYDFLGFSSKMSEKSLFLIIARGEKLNADKIHDNLLGKVLVLQEKVLNDPNSPLHYRNLVYYCQRMDNCLAQGLKLGELLNEKNLDFAYEEGSLLFQEAKIELFDKDNKSYGLISKDLLEVLNEKFKRIFSVLLVNFFGIRMKLVFSNEIPEKTIRIPLEIYEKVRNEVFFLRKDEGISLEKIEEGLFIDIDHSFKASDIQILDFGDIKMGFLNHNLIEIFRHLEETSRLEFKGFIDINNFLIKALKKLLENLQKGYLNSRFLKDFQSFDLKNRLNPLDKRNFYDFQNIFKDFIDNQEKTPFSNDVFWKMLKDTMILAVLTRLEKKLAFSPFQNFHSLLYLEDPIGLLAENEAFLQIISQNSKKIEVLKGKSLIFRDFAIDFREFRTISLIDNEKYRPYMNILIISRDLSKEIKDFLPVPYNKEDRIMLINDPAIIFKDLERKPETKESLESAYKLVFQRTRESPEHTFVRLYNIEDFFLNFMEENALKNTAKINFLLYSLNSNKRLLKPEELMESEDHNNLFLSYLNALFAVYLCQFQLEPKSTNMKICPDFMMNRIKGNMESQNIEISMSLSGTLYREILGFREKLIRKMNKGVLYEFQQTHFDENLSISLEKPDIVKEIIEILRVYYREMGFLLEDLGALNESEVFLGVLIEKSRFQRKKHAEKFGLLSQIGLSNLQRKIEGFYKQKFIDFEENKAFYAKYTYTITYYYSGCFLKDIKEEIMNLLEDFDKGNKAFLGLVWLIFAEVFLKNNKTF